MGIDLNPVNWVKSAGRKLEQAGEGVAEFFGAGQDTGRHPVNARNRGKEDGSIGYSSYGKRYSGHAWDDIEKETRETHGPTGGQIYGDELRRQYGGYQTQASQTVNTGFLSGPITIGERGRLISGDISYYANFFGSRNDRDLAFNTVGGTTWQMDESASSSPGVYTENYSTQHTGTNLGNRSNLREVMKFEASSRSAFLESYFRN